MSLLSIIPQPKLDRCLALCLGQGRELENYIDLIQAPISSLIFFGLKLLSNSRTSSTEARLVTEPGPRSPEPEVGPGPGQSRSQFAEDRQTRAGEADVLRGCRSPQSVVNISLLTNNERLKAPILSAVLKI